MSPVVEGSRKEKKVGGKRLGVRESELGGCQGGGKAVGGGARGAIVKEQGPQKIQGGCEQ